VLWAKSASVIIPDNFLGRIAVKCNASFADLCVEGSVREFGSVVPRCIVKTDENGEAVLPVLNISGKDLITAGNQTISRGELCVKGVHQREVNTSRCRYCGGVGFAIRKSCAVTEKEVWCSANVRRLQRAE
jgi:hypothetical protein